MSSLVDVAFLIFFFFIVFAIAGQQLFIGSMRNRCYERPYTNHTNITNATLETCFQYDGELCYGEFETRHGELHPQTKWIVDGDLCSDWYGSGASFQGLGRQCEDDLPGDTDYVCTNTPKVKNPNYGFTGFDNFLLSMNTVAVIVSLEGHEEIMYDLSESTSNMVGIGFVTIVVTLCSMFAVNLVLAVIFDAYVSVVEGSGELLLKRSQSKAQRRLVHRQEAERQLVQRGSGTSGQRGSGTMG